MMDFLMVRCQRFIKMGQGEVFEVIKKNPGITIREIAKIVNITEGNTGRSCRILRKSGFVYTKTITGRHGGDINKHYARRN